MNSVQYLSRQDKKVYHYNRVFIDLLKKYNITEIKHLEKLNSIRKDVKKVPPENTSIVIDKSLLTYEEVFLNAQEVLKDIAAKETILDIEELVKSDIEAERIRQEKQELDQVICNVKDCLLRSERHDATEEIVKHIKSKYQIYTTRSDNKPEMWIYHKGIYIPEGETFIKETCRKILQNILTGHLLNEVILKIQTDTYINQDEFFSKDTDLDLIPVSNGLFSLRTGILSPFSRDKFFFSKLPLKYKKSAVCPNICEFLKDILKNEEDLPVVQELMGSFLMRENIWEKAFMFLGTGRNGKSKLLELIKRLLGIENCVNISITRLNTEPFVRSELFGKLANLGADISATPIKDAGYFKECTGRDTISAPRKFMKDLTFKPYAKMVFCANELPLTYDKTEAFFQRWVILDFPYTFLPAEEINTVEDKTCIKLRDPEIINKIATESEMSGFFNWAVEGLQRLLYNKDFSYCKNTQETKKQWIRKSDSFSAFCMDCLEEDYDSRIKKSELKQEYSLYCRRNKLNIVSDKRIKHVLEIDMGTSEGRLSSEEGGRDYCWIGITFKESDVHGVQESYPFSTLGRFSNSTIGKKQVDRVDTLDTLDEKNNLEIFEEEVK